MASGRDSRAVLPVGRSRSEMLISAPTTRQGAGFRDLQWKSKKLAGHALETLPPGVVACSAHQ